MPVESFLGLGGNVGDVVSSFISAISFLEAQEGVSILAVSPVYKTPPWGMEEQDWFHNTCIKLQTTLSPNKMLVLCKQIEQNLNRQKTVHWGPRTIDLDILTYGEESIADEGLTIPHAQMTNRAFVLVPLKDIAPDLIIQEQSIDYWLSQLDLNEIQNINLPQRWWDNSNVMK